MKEKDPAFLFYSSDFLTGTQFFTDEQVGKYIRLICLMHQHGRLDKDDIEFVCTDEKVLKKFHIDDDGKYYQPRLEKEMIKRAKYTQSRRDNLQGKNPHMDVHMEDDMESHMESHMGETMIAHMENENEIVNKDINTVVNVNKKKVKVAEFVSMTNDEYSSLVAKLGESGAERCIEILDNYKGSKGKTYKSDYRAILSWVVGEYEKQAATARERKPSNFYEELAEVIARESGAT